MLGRPPAAASTALCPLGGAGAQGDTTASLPGAACTLPGTPHQESSPPAPHTGRAWPWPPSPAARALHSGIRPQDPVVMALGALVDEGFVSVSHSVPAYLLEKAPPCRAGRAFLTRPGHAAPALVCVAVGTVPQYLFSACFQDNTGFLFCPDSVALGAGLSLLALVIGERARGQRAHPELLCPSYPRGSLCPHPSGTGGMLANPEQGRC